ncbi:MAG: LCP family protein [Lachnospiraceae bacterium]|nr:LCP family protein [Lachnospiraceae bacterium]MBR4058774.1 LCP family protein [Lachnospiraceae bacterium]
MATQNTSRKAGNGKNKAKKTRNIVILVIEVLVLAMMLGVLWFVTKATDEDTGIQRVEIPEEEIEVNEGVEENENLEKYRTVALFGLDSTVGELKQNTRSDTIMIASINSETKEVRLMSVYRDTYLNLGNDTYNKCNAAYAKGGPKQAINMLNMNLDLDITDFAAVGFKGVIDVVDAVGGIWIEVDSAELEHINNYQISISENLKTSYTPVKTTGLQKLNGLQATAYCRIRYTAGDDFKRTERQREVLQAIMEEAKDLDVASLTKIANNVFGNFYTSVDLQEVISLLSDLPSYTIIDEGGFPSNDFRTGATIGGIGDSVICTDLEKAVMDFHKRFFQDEEYVVSDTLKGISQTIHANTDAYVR